MASCKERFVDEWRELSSYRSGDKSVVSMASTGWNPEVVRYVRQGVTNHGFSMGALFWGGFDERSQRDELPVEGKKTMLSS
jgi:hypothetical protein